jgi:glutaredoxin
MLTLYTRATCPFCQKVEDLITEMNLTVERKDISKNDAFREELLAKGGKQQVPYLVDSDKGVAMYESDDIMDFLEINYSSVGEQATDGPRVHGSANVCIACEG